MNIRDNFPGSGIGSLYAKSTNQSAEDILAASDAEDDKLNADIAEDLARELPKQTLIDGTRGTFERTIVNHRAEKARQQAIASAAMAKARQLTVSIRSLEDALDSLLASEA